MADGEGYEAAGERLENAMTRLMGQFGAQMLEATRPPQYRYQLVEWEQVNVLADAGWKMVAAHIELTSFVMVLELGPAHEAAAMLDQHLFGLPPPDGGDPGT